MNFWRAIFWWNLASLRDGLSASPSLMPVKKNHCLARFGHGEIRRRVNWVHVSMSVMSEIPAVGPSAYLTIIHHMHPAQGIRTHSCLSGLVPTLPVAINRSVWAPFTQPSHLISMNIKQIEIWEKYFGAHKTLPRRLTLVNPNLKP